MDLMQMALRGMGIDLDPAAIMEQAAKIGGAFEGIERQLNVIANNQSALMLHLGMAVTPSPEVLALMQTESIAAVQRIEAEAADAVQAEAGQAEAVQAEAVPKGRVLKRLVQAAKVVRTGDGQPVIAWVP